MATQSPQVRKRQASLTPGQRISQSSSVRIRITYHPFLMETLFAQNTMFRAECSLSVLFSYPFCLLSLSLQVYGSALFPPSLRTQTFTPPLVLRIGFGTIFAGAGYVLASGDSRNGSGIATGNDISYLNIQPQDCPH